MKFSFQALGTTWWIEVWDDLTDKSHDEVKDFVMAFVTQFEDNYSRFKSNSLISILNRERTLARPTAELITLLEYGKQLYLRSDTHFNFLTGHILEARGYDADYSFADSGSDMLTAGNPITDLCIIDDTLTLKHGNVDIGGYGKGYLIDLLSSEFGRRFDLQQFLINGGGDMYATHQAGEAVTIYLEHPTKPGVMIGSTTLHNQAFAASSPHRRHWPTKDGGTQHHITADAITFDATFIKTAKASDADAFATTALQLTQTQLATLAKAEGLAVALFDLQSGDLLSSKDFN